MTSQPPSAFVLVFQLFFHSHSSSHCVRWKVSNCGEHQNLRITEKKTELNCEWTCLTCMLTAKRDCMSILKVIKCHCCDGSLCQPAQRIARWFKKTDVFFRIVTPTNRDLLTTALLFLNQFMKDKPWHGFHNDKTNTAKQTKREAIRWHTHFSSAKP